MKWLALMVEGRLVSQEVLGLVVRRSLGLFYTDDSVVGSWYPEWIQGALNVLIGLLCRYRLVENVAKSKAMTCQLGTLQSWMSEEVLVQLFTVRGWRTASIW